MGPVDWPIATSQTRFGWASGSLAAGHRPAQRGVERQPQAVADHGLVGRGVPRGQGERRSVVEDLAALEVLEVRAARP